MTIAKGGDSFVASFDSSGDAVAAAVVAQELLAASTWHTPDGIQVRMGVHLGAAQRRGDGWYGQPLNEAARMMAVAHGGQIVASKVIVGRGAAVFPSSISVSIGFATSTARTTSSRWWCPG